MTYRKQLMTPNVRHVLIVGLALSLVALPQAAMADPTNITTGLTSIQTWLTTAAKTIAVIAVIGCGLAKMVGRMQWGYFFSVIAGCALVFGAAEISTWMQSS